jgi:hypothetical protein
MACGEKKDSDDGLKRTYALSKCKKSGQYYRPNRHRRRIQI